MNTHTMNVVITLMLQRQVLLFMLTVWIRHALGRWCGVLTSVHRSPSFSFTKPHEHLAVA